MVNLIRFLLFFLTVQVALADDKIYTAEEKAITGAVLMYDGVLIPGKVVEIISPIHAMVTQVHFDFGDTVSQNQLLFEMDPKESEMALATARTELLEQNYQIEKLKNWQASSEVVKAKYNLERELKHYEYAKEHFKQSEKLYTAGIISREEFLLDQRHNEDSFHNYQNAKELLEEILRKGDPSYLLLAQMKQKQIEDRIKMIENKLDHAKLNSPINGVILPPTASKNANSIRSQKKVYSAGQLMAIIADMDNPAIEFKVDELDVVKIKKDQTVFVQFLTFPKYKLEGRIQEISLNANLANEGTQGSKFFVRVSLLEMPELLRKKLYLGFSATVTLKPEILKGLVIPKEAIVQTENTHYVHVLKNNQTHKQVVEIADISEDYVVISKGIQQGDQIVIQS